MTRTTNIDFFTVKLGSGAPFEPILQQVSETPNDRRRNVDVLGHPIRLAEAAKDRDGIWDCDLVKIRMDNLPVRASIDGSKTDLNLNSDEGLGEETAFMFIPKFQVLVIQRNRLGVSTKRFCEYFENFGHPRRAVDVEPILSGAALQKLGSIQEHRCFEIRVAGIHNADALRKTGVSVGGLANVMEELDSPSAYLNLSVGVGGRDGGHRSLNRNAIIQAVKQVLRMPGREGAIKTLRLRGRDAAHEMVPIDFLVDRIFHTTTLTSGANRRISYQTRLQAVRSAWELHKEEIARILAPG